MMPNMSDPLRDSWWPYIVAFVVGIITVIRSYMGGPSCPSKAHIDGKVVIVTGGSSGMGYETALELVRRGARVIIGCKNLPSGEKAAQEIIRKTGREDAVEARELNLASLDSVKQFVKKLELEVIDILVNNAGIMWYPFQKTEEGFELHFVTNYLGHFLLTHLLLPKLKKSSQGRVINISAMAHRVSNIRIDDLNRETEFVPREAYGQSKLALIYFTRFLAEKLKKVGTKVTINSVNPGLVRGTQLFRHSPFNSTFVMKFSMAPWLWLFTKSAKQGAQTAIYLSVGPDLATTTGEYFSDCQPQEPGDCALDDNLGKTFYTRSCELAGIEDVQ